MKKTALVFFSIIAGFLPLQLSAQCGVFAQEALDKYGRGTYLMSQELDNQGNSELTMVLKKGNTYVLYLLNPSEKITNYSLTSSTGILEHSSVFLHKHDNYISYILKPSKTREHKFTLHIGSNKQACVVFALYYEDTGLKPGIYRDFSDLKNNSPSEKRTFDLKDRYDGYNDVCIIRGEGLPKGSYGFSDGVDRYVNLKSVNKNLIGNIYMRLEDLDEYYYFKIVEVIQGSVLIVSEEENIINAETGEVNRLNRKVLREILQENPQLLAQFEAENMKSKKLKEYLIKYIGSK